MFARLSDTFRYLVGYPVQSEKKEVPEQVPEVPVKIEVAQETLEIKTTEPAESPKTTAELKRKLSSPNVGSPVALSPSSSSSLSSSSPKRAKSAASEEVSLQVVAADATPTATLPVYPVGPYYGNPANIYNAANQKPSYSAVVKSADEPAPAVLSRRM